MQIRPSYAVILQTQNGMTILPRHDIYRPSSIIRTGLSAIHDEVETLKIIAHHLPEGAVVIDAGANIGDVSVPLGHVLAHKMGTLIAFEPQRIIYYMLAGNVALAGLENVICHQIALGNAEGMICLPSIDYHAPSDFGQVSLDTIDHGRRTEASSAKNEEVGEEVVVTQIDSLNLARIDLIKIDVERMEMAVLAGAEKSISQYTPLIWIEAWPEAHQRLFAWMSARQYRIYVADRLNFFCVHESMSLQYSVSMPLYDGKAHPYWPANADTSRD